MNWIRKNRKDIGQIRKQLLINYIQVFVLSSALSTHELFVTTHESSMVYEEN